MIALLLVWDMLVALIFGNKRALKLFPYLFVVQKVVGVGLIAFGLNLIVTGLVNAK